MYAVNNGYLKDIPVEAIKEFEVEFYRHMDDVHPEVAQGIKATKELSAENEAVLKQALIDFTKSFLAGR